LIDNPIFEIWSISGQSVDTRVRPEGKAPRFFSWLWIRAHPLVCIGGGSFNIFLSQPQDSEELVL
jgi:hypothetical protein